jgi:hypothetical protein
VVSAPNRPSSTPPARLRSPSLGHAEVEDLQRPRLASAMTRHEQVVRLDVAMSDAAFVRELGAWATGASRHRLGQRRGRPPCDQDLLEGSPSNHSG